MASQKPPMSATPPRFIIIGAGSRGSAYARAIDEASVGVVAAVADPIQFRRETLGRKHIWRDGSPQSGQCFSDWREFVAHEKARRRRTDDDDGGVSGHLGVDGAFVCVQDGQHREVVLGLAPLGIHIMCEKPLAPSLSDCLEVYAALQPQHKTAVFAIGHVLRYSPHNRLLRKLLVEDRVVGAVHAVTHTEPVGWWHFAHSFVRGSWRNTTTSAPSLLTKCCHDVDLMLWMLTEPSTEQKSGSSSPHLPSTVSSSGGITTFTKSRKPPAAGPATNCMACPLGDAGCKYSAKNIYLGPHLRGLESGNTDWPVSVVVDDIEDLPSLDARRAALAAALAQDWHPDTHSKSLVASRNWFGRCVFEADNDVCDHQVVTMDWAESSRGPAKRATIHMVANTTKMCDRYSHWYGEDGEIYADSHTIVIEDFNTGQTRTYRPEDSAGGGHGGGDVGLATQFVLACDRVKNHGWDADVAQAAFLGCSLQDVIRSHAMVFAAEDARVGEKVVGWDEWWHQAVTSSLDPALHFT